MKIHDLNTGDYLFFKINDGFVTDVKTKFEPLSPEQNAQIQATFGGCAETLGDACIGDNGCAFMCGIMWQYCLGAGAAACAYIHIRDNWF